jgi:hypothetical protein
MKYFAVLQEKGRRVAPFRDLATIKRRASGLADGGSVQESLPFTGGVSFGTKLLQAKFRQWRPSKPLCEFPRGRSRHEHEKNDAARRRLLPPPQQSQASAAF